MIPIQNLIIKATLKKNINYDVKSFLNRKKSQQFNNI